MIASSRRLAALLACGLAPVLLGGCATMFTGSTDMVTFEANVPGVRLTIDGQYRGELPLTLELSRNFMSGQMFLARFEAPGYQEQAFPLRREFNTAAILDVTSPVTSGGIDVLTGSIMQYSPRAYRVEMLPKGGSATTRAFRREVELDGFALANFRALQRDLARGGGEHLAAFAALVADGDPALTRSVTEAAVLGAPPLLAATEAPAFAAGFDKLLASRQDLEALRWSAR